MKQLDSNLIWEAYTGPTIVQEGIDFDQFKHKLKRANPKALKDTIMSKVSDITPIKDGLVMSLIFSSSYAAGLGARQLYEFLIGNMPEDDFFQWLSEFLK